MKHRLIYMMLSAAAALTAGAQVTPRSAFTTAPTMVFPTLPQSTRLDMIDYYEGGSAKTMPNQLDGACMIESMSADEITLSTGKLSKTTIVILPADGKETIMVINDVAMPEVDSDIRFYNSRWEELDRRRILPEPSLADWIGKQPAEKLVDIENALPFMTSVAHYAPQSRELTLTPTVVRMLNDDEKKVVEPVLKPSLRYHWTGKKFTPVKK